MGTQSDKSGSGKSSIDGPEKGSKCQMATSADKTKGGVEVANRLLQSLSGAESAALLPRLNPVAFRPGSLLVRKGQIDACLFIERGVASILLRPQGHDPVEVGIVGNEGLIGLSAVLGSDTVTYQVVTLSGCDALAISPGELRGVIEQQPGIERVLLRYANSRLVQAMQLAACHLHHHLERRLAGWIMAMSDLMQSLQIVVTHKQLALLLGVTRQSVTGALQILEGQQAIWSKRSTVIIRERSVLRQISCGCHATAGQKGGLGFVLSGPSLVG